MRRLFSLLAVALLGLAPLAQLSASAESAGWNEAWDGVYIPDPKVDPSKAAPTEFRDGLVSAAIGSQLASFQVLFENEHDYVPEVTAPEFMVVYVAKGSFVLDVKGPGSFTVDPAPHEETGENIEIMVGTVSPDGKDITYTTTGTFIVDERGGECQTLCSVFPGYAVRLTAGDQIIAPAGTTCVWCLLQEEPDSPQQVQADVLAMDVPGALFVYPLLRGDDFSWRQQHAHPANIAFSPDSGLANADAARVKMAWAYGPGSNCG